MNKSSKIVLGILGAAAIGVVIGGLLYTEKGKEIREKIGSRASDARDEIADLIRRGKEKASGAASQVSKHANGLKTSAEDFVA